MLGKELVEKLAAVGLGAHKLVVARELVKQMPDISAESLTNKIRDDGHWAQSTLQLVAGIMKPVKAKA